jgi:polyisoprenoid-binding protein YceI
MRKTSSALAWLAAVALTASMAGAQTSTWKIDPAHSEAEFSVKHMGISNVHGRFGNVNGTVIIDDSDSSKSSANATIDTSTVDTGVAQRDAHLKSPDFFEVAKYPAMTFVSKQITKSGDSLQVVGDLTLHGVTKSVTLQVEGPSKEQADPYGKIRRGLSASTTVHRQDFGLVWQGTLKSGDTVVGDDVKIELNVEMIKQ